jgi:SpoIID/LytB domain protein
MRPLVPLVAVLALTAAGGALLTVAARGDELTGDDKLRMLYSHRFNFARSGLPELTVEIMSGQRKVSLSAAGGLHLLPDGDDGASVEGPSGWTVTVENAHPAQLRHWIVVAHEASASTLATWKDRGYAPQTFEIGTVFGVEGEMIDSRQTLVGVAPEREEAAAGRAARAIASKYGIDTSLYDELVARPRGTLVARADGGTVVRHDGVLWFAASAKDGTITVADVLHGGGGSQVGAERRQTRAYFGQVYVTLDSSGALTVVNAIPEDRLLMGLVPSEIFPDAPRDALAAQAVAARTELLAKIGTRHLTDPYLVCSSQHCQVYGGVGLEDGRTTAAVKATRGEVIMRPGGGLVQAYYSASCGGFGEDNDHVWGLPPDPQLRGHLDAEGAGKKTLAAFAGGIDEGNMRRFLDSPREAAACGRGKWSEGRYRWRVELAEGELDRLVAAEHPEVGHVTALTGRQRGISGRIGSLEIVGDHGKVKVEGDLKIRRLLGGLKSAAFLARNAGGRWIIEGAGFGHGVGMCQTGAIGMAAAGRNYRDILGHYYQGSHVHALY